MTPRQKYQPRHAPRGRSGRMFSRGVVLLTVCASVLGVAGTAEAYFSATGNGTASTSTNSGSALTNVTVSASGSKVYPGGSGDLTFKVHNPNSLAFTITGASAGTPTASCTTPAVSVTVPSGLSITVPAGSDQTVSWSGSVAMGATASDDCQGQTITVPLSLTGKTS
jgi:hypothetical protein